MSKYIAYVCVLCIYICVYIYTLLSAQLWRLVFDKIGCRQQTKWSGLICPSSTVTNRQELSISLLCLPNICYVKFTCLLVTLLCLLGLDRKLPKQPLIDFQLHKGQDNGPCRPAAARTCRTRPSPVTFEFGSHFSLRPWWPWVWHLKNAQNGLLGSFGTLWDCEHETCELQPPLFPCLRLLVLTHPDSSPGKAFYASAILDTNKIKYCKWFSWHSLRSLQ